MTAHKAKVLIVDDHPMLREGLALRINREEDLLACCEADSAESALAACEACSHDLALVDLRLADSSGLSLIRQLRQKYPTLPILVVSMYDENVYAERALQAGAQGYIMKQEATDTLIQAIRLVLGGELYVSDKLRSYLSGANSFVCKPLDFSEFAATVAQLGLYWMAINRLPDGS